jgi:hypothetical protein
MEPFLVFRRTGRFIAAVLALGFGGGTLLLGIGSTMIAAPSLHALWGSFRSYLLVTLPFFLAGGILALCRRELWFVPELRAFRMLTFRPWLFSGPRVEQGSIDDYRGLCTEVTDASEVAVVVSLVTGGGERVPVREFDKPAEAQAFAQRFAEITGLPLSAEP